MKAMIFAAGLGTRLRPLTNNKPKALVEYRGVPLLQTAIEKLKAEDFDDIVINVHHFAQKIKDFLIKNNNFNIQISISDETEELLETGGGLFFAKNFFNDSPFLLYNADIISSINLKELYSFHLKNNSIATLAVQNRDSSKKLYFNSDNYLCKWKDEETGEEKISRNSNLLTPYAFSGIHIVNPEIFNFMEKGKYSIIDTYLQIAKTKKISYFDHSSDFWKDMGKPESFTF